MTLSIDIYEHQRGDSPFIAALVAAPNPPCTFVLGAAATFRAVCAAGGNLESETIASVAGSVPCRHNDGGDDDDVAFLIFDSLLERGFFLCRGCCGFCEIVKYDVFRRVGKGDNRRRETSRRERRSFYRRGMST